MKADSKQGNNLDISPFTAALVNVLTFVVGTFSEYAITDAKKHDLAGELELWFKMFNFSVSKASFAAGKAFGAL